MIRIGTSGWHYRDFYGSFYPRDLPSSEMLGYYASRLDAVEVDSRYHKLPDHSALYQWSNITPTNFRFSIQANRYMTHVMKLMDPGPAIRQFLKVTEVLGEKLGPVLIPLPPRWQLDIDRLKAFLRALPRNYHFSIEFTDPSWWTPQVFDLLRKHNVAFCINDQGSQEAPVEVTADYVYVRLHGTQGAREGSYSKDVLSLWAERALHWNRESKEVYIFFDNATAGAAARDALSLTEICGTARSGEEKTGSWRRRKLAENSR